MGLPVKQHDPLFRALVSNPARAGALLAEYLPRKVAGLLDPLSPPPDAVERSFVDEDASKTQCDALFKVRLRTGHKARIYVLFEHKSHVGADTPLQILRYMVNIWLRGIADGTVGDRPPPILPLVCYPGRRAGRYRAQRPRRSTRAASSRHSCATSPMF